MSGVPSRPAGQACAPKDRPDRLHARAGGAGKWWSRGEFGELAGLGRLGGRGCRQLFSRRPSRASGTRSRRLGRRASESGVARFETNSKFETHFVVAGVEFQVPVFGKLESCARSLVITLRAGASAWWMYPPSRRRIATPWPAFW